MAKWHALMEYVQFPLKILFAATLMLGVGNALINPNIAYLWEIDNEIIIMICEMHPKELDFVSLQSTSISDTMLCTINAYLL